MLTRGEGVILGVSHTPFQGRAPCAPKFKGPPLYPRLYGTATKLMYVMIKLDERKIFIGSTVALAMD